MVPALPVLAVLRAGGESARIGSALKTLPPDVFESNLLSTDGSGR